MYQFIWPIVLLLLPLPLVVRFLLRAVSAPAQNLSGAIKVPFFDRLKKVKAPTEAGSSSFSRWLWILTWVSFVLAAARPVWIGAPITTNKEARNIMLALDVSGSMEERDFDVRGHPITRLDIVKYLAQDFIQKRQGDNLGLVIFGSEAYTYAPLSPDAKTLTGLMDEIGIGIAGTQTAMGDALALATQNVASVPENARIVILLSDGISNAGVISMDEALTLAQNAGVKVYTIGIGSDKQEIQDFFGFVQMETAPDLDEDTLKKVAQETGGQYFRAKSTSDLKQIYQLIDALETTEVEETTYRPRKEMAFYFILMGLGLWFLSLLTRRH